MWPDRRLGSASQGCQWPLSLPLLCGPRVPLGPGSLGSVSKSEGRPSNFCLLPRMWGPREAGLEGMAVVTASLVLPTGAPREAERGAVAVLGSTGCWETLFPAAGPASSHSALVPVLGALSKPGPRPRQHFPLGRRFQIRGPQRQQLCEAGSPRAPHSLRPTPLRDLLGEASLSSVGAAGSGDCPFSVASPLLPLTSHLPPLWFVPPKVPWDLGGGRLRTPSPGSHR